MFFHDKGETDWGYDTVTRRCFPNVSSSSVDLKHSVSIERGSQASLASLFCLIYGEDLRFIDIVNKTLREKQVLLWQRYESEKDGLTIDQKMWLGEQRVRKAAEVFGRLSKELEGHKKSEALELWIAEGYMSAINDLPIPEKEFRLKNAFETIVKLYDENGDPDGKLGGKMFDQLQRVGFVKNIFGRRLWSADTELDIVSWVISSNIRDIITKQCYEMSMILEPYGGLCWCDCKDTDNPLIYINYGTYDKDRAVLDIELVHPTFLSHRALLEWEYK